MTRPDSSQSQRARFLAIKGPADAVPNYKKRNLHPNNLAHMKQEYWKCSYNSTYCAIYQIIRSREWLLYAINVLHEVMWTIINSSVSRACDFFKIVLLSLTSASFIIFMGFISSCMVCFSRTPRLCFNVKHSSDLTPYRTLWFAVGFVMFQLCVYMLWNLNLRLFCARKCIWHPFSCDMGLDGTLDKPYRTRLRLVRYDLSRVPSKPISHSNGYHMHIIWVTRSLDLWGSYTLFGSVDCVWYLFWLNCLIVPWHGLGYFYRCVFVRWIMDRAVTSRRVLGYGYSLVKEPVPKSGTEYLLVSFNYNDRGMQTDRIMLKWSNVLLRSLLLLLR